MDPVLRTCRVCNKVFSSRTNLKRHSKKIHRIELPVERNNPLICMLCEGRFGTFVNYKEHLALQHGINLLSEILEFKTHEEFYRWKEKMENSNRVSFVKSSGSKKFNKYTRIYFQCKRSGFYKPSVGSNGRKRELKRQGSCKINGVCPSNMKVKFFENSKVTVDYCRTHVGHATDLAHVHLSKDERKMLASKIFNCVPFTTILNETQGTLLESEALNRIHLLKRQDLHNIARRFDFNDEKAFDPNFSNSNYNKHDNNYDDAASVDEWFLNDKLTNDNSASFHKPVSGETEATSNNANQRRMPTTSTTNKRRILRKAQHCTRMLYKCQLDESRRRKVEKLLDSLLEICASSMPSASTSSSVLVSQVKTGKKIEKQKLVCSTKKNMKGSQFRKTTVEKAAPIKKRLISNDEDVHVHTGFDHQYY